MDQFIYFFSTFRYSEKKKKKKKKPFNLLRKLDPFQPILLGIYPIWITIILD